MTFHIRSTFSNVHLDEKWKSFAFNVIEGFFLLNIIKRFLPHN